MNKTKNAPKPKPKPRAAKAAPRRKAQNNKKGAQKFVTRWVRSVASPWGSFPAHIPDANTTRAGLCTSHVQYMGQPTSASQSTRGFGFCLPAFPVFTYIVDQTQDATVPGYGDVITGGTLYATPFSTAGQTTPLQVPNLASLIGTTTQNTERTRIRCCGMSLTCTYEGSELNRAGKYIAALVPVTGVGSIYPATGTRVGPLSAALSTGDGLPNIQLVDIRKQAVKYVEERVSDRTFTCRWIPQGAPTYQLVRTPVAADNTNGAGVTPTSSTWAVAPGQFGVQSGQNVLIFMMDGDNTGAANTVGNLYTVNINWSWEVIPDDHDSVSYPLEESPSNQAVLDSCLNAFQRMTVSPTPGNGQAAS